MCNEELPRDALSERQPNSGAARQENCQVTGDDQPLGSNISSTESTQE